MTRTLPWWLRWWISGILATVPACAEAPFDIWKSRANLSAQEAQLLQRYQAQIPASSLRPDGTVNPQDPAYAALKERYAAEHKQLMGESKTADPRKSFFDAMKGQDTGGVFRPEDLAGIKVQNSGSEPGTPFADMDVLPDSVEDTKKIIDMLRKKGFTVENTGLRWEVKELDMVMWKPTPDRLDSARELFTQEKARAMSDAYSPEGAIYAATHGKAGIEDPYGAGMANVKKGLDARAAAAAGKGDPRLLLKDELKSVVKAAEYTGLDLRELDEGLYQMAKDMKAYGSPQGAGPYELLETADSQAAKLKDLQARMDRVYQKALETGAAKSKLKVQQREEAALRALEAGDKDAFLKLREENRLVNSSNRITEQQMARDYPEGTKRLTGNDPTSPAGREELARGRTETVRDNLSGKTPPPAEPVKPMSVGEFAGHLMNGMFVAGQAAHTYTKEMDDSIRDGREFSRVNAAGNVLKDLVITPFLAGQQITNDLFREMAANGETNRLEAFFKGVWRVGESMGYTTSKQILEEEALKEFAKIQQDRERAQGLRDLGITVASDPQWTPGHALAAKVSGAMRIAGEMTMMNSIIEALTRDFDAERAGAETPRRLQDYMRANGARGIVAVDELRAELAELRKQDPRDPEVAAKIAVRERWLAEEQTALTKLADGMAKPGALGPDHPLVAALSDVVKSFTDSAAMLGPERSFTDSAEMLGPRRGFTDSAALLGPERSFTDSAALLGERRQEDVPLEAVVPPAQTFTVAGPRTDIGPASPAPGPATFTAVGGATTISATPANPAPTAPVASQAPDPCSGARLQATLAAMGEARQMLNAPNPTEAGAIAAADAARRAQTLAPPCLSQQVSSLTGPINNVLAAAKQIEANVRQAQREANRAATQAAMGALGAALTSSMNAAIAAQNGQSSAGPVTPQIGPAPNAATADRDQAEEFRRLTGQSAPAPTAPGPAAAAGPAPPPCQTCSIRTQTAAGDVAFSVSLVQSVGRPTAACQGGINHTAYVITGRPDRGVNTCAPNVDCTALANVQRQAQQACPNPQPPPQ